VRSYSAASLTGVAALRLPAGGQIEQIGGQLVEIGENFGRWEDVGIFGMYIAQADGVADLAPIETILLREDHPII
jgi:hypothetical protein